jgi:hypothetical protein
MSTIPWAAYGLNLGTVRSRVQRKVGDSEVPPAEIDGWINDVVQTITAEFPLPELASHGDDVLTGDGLAQTFELPDDFQHPLSFWIPELGYRVIDEVTQQELVEGYLTNPITVRDPDVYVIMGRKTGAASAEIESTTMQVLNVKFDSIPVLSSEIYYAYYRYHYLLQNDTDPIYLPQSWQSLLVDGVLLESDAYRDHEDYERHERKWYRKLRRAYKNRFRRSNRPIILGGGVQSTRPARPRLPANFPRSPFHG